MECCCGVLCLGGMGPVGGAYMIGEEHILICRLVDRTVLLATTIHKLGAGVWEG